MKPATIPTACGNVVQVGETLDFSALQVTIADRDVTVPDRVARLSMRGVVELHRELGQWLLENAWVDDVYVGPLDAQRNPLVEERDGYVVTP